MNRLLALSVLSLLFSAVVQAATNPKTTEQILQSYVDDFRLDPSASGPEGFAVRVTGDGGGDWHVTVGSRLADGKTEVALRRGLPQAPYWFYKLDVATLASLDHSEINVLTAMGKQHERDAAPMDIDATSDFQPAPDWEARVLPLTFHFWTRGLPETVAFGKSFSRVLHGANVVAFYYQKGIRTMWAQVEKGQHVDEGGSANPFPTIVVVVRGAVMTRIGGVERKLRAGETAFVPAGVTDEDWNPFDEPAEVVLIMFGDQA